MSRVTNVILSVEVLIKPHLMGAINSRLMSRYKNCLWQVNDHAGGNRDMEVDVWIGAFNYFDVSMLETQLYSWPIGICYTLMVQEQDDNIFRIVKSND